MDWDHTLQQIAASAIFGVFGIVLFALAIKIIVKVTPFSVRKEIEEDQNVALAVLLGAILLGLAIIVAAAIH
jgi:putative membrane protein